MFSHYFSLMNDCGVASSKRSVSWNAARKTAHEKNINSERERKKARQLVGFSCHSYFESSSRNISNFVPRKPDLKDFKTHLITEKSAENRTANAPGMNRCHEPYLHTISHFPVISV